MKYKKITEKLDIVELKLNEQILKINNVDQIKTQEIINATCKTPESLSLIDTNMVTLPLKVIGKMLGVGRHKDKFYTAEDLQWAVDFHTEKKFPIKLDHRHTEISSMVGVVDKIFWDDGEQAIMYEGHINDETQARNILDNMVTQVSATVSSITESNEEQGVIGREPEFEELSLVVKGAYTGNTIIPIV